jgi:hypothetical protein
MRVKAAGGDLSAIKEVESDGAAHFHPAREPLHQT